jgi:opacity protein-like surface antigen
MKTVLAVLPLLAGVAITPANAQLAGFSGRAELRAGYDEVRAKATILNEAFTEDFGDDDIAYGIELGADAHITDTVTVGAYAGVDFSDVDGCEPDVFDDGDSACIRAGRNYMLGARAGVQTGDFGLFYGKIGLSRGKFRGSYTDDEDELFFEDSDKVKGWHVGAGFELGLTRNVYFKGEYLHHWYDDAFAGGIDEPDGVDLRRHQLMAGIGFRFGGRAVEPVADLPPPPPAPVAPATQTCPDGSVIMATDVCPLPPAPPPPPPPPPEPSGERG